MSEESRRIEKDSLGEVFVENDKLWGAQTERALNNFKIGTEKIDFAVIRSFGYLKKAAAICNYELGKISQEKKELIVKSCDDIIEGKINGHFPLPVWQTGSGTGTNMNINEVISNLAKISSGLPLEEKGPLHPNDDVNMSQSSNDTFPTAMNIAAVMEIEDLLLPAGESLQLAFEKKVKEFQDIIKIGRTHLMDAVPLSFAQEFSGYVSQIKNALLSIRSVSLELYELAIGGTAVGTGLNTHPEYAERMAGKLSELTGRPFKTAANKFESLASHDNIVLVSSALKRLACALMKVGNDIRWLGSGPRCGLGELKLPANEPGSSIMPGKVNPTQCEALTMVCSQVIGNDVTISIAGSQGNFELNVYKPVIIHNLLQSIRLLADSMNSFNVHCIKGLSVDYDRVNQHLENSLMLVTALNQHIGYEKAAKVAQKAYSENISLKESIVQLGYMSEEKFLSVIDPKKMIGPS